LDKLQNITKCKNGDGSIKWGFTCFRSHRIYSIDAKVWFVRLVTRMCLTKTAELIEMPFGGWLNRSRLDESISRRERWQDGDAAFRQNFRTTCSKVLYQNVPN